MYDTLDIVMHIIYVAICDHTHIYIYNIYIYIHIMTLYYVYYLSTCIIYAQLIAIFVHLSAMA